jgi:hypothetical protein
MLRFPCPRCGKVLQAPEEKAGAQTMCRYCREPLAVPAAAVAEAIAAAPVAVSPPMATLVSAPPLAVLAALPTSPLAQHSPDAGSVEPVSFGTAFSKDLGITAFGAATSLATAVLLWIVEITCNFSFYTISAVFVIPAGAMISGGLAATGYYWGAKLTGRRPTRWLLLNMLAISLFTFFLIHLLSYATLKMAAGDPLGNMGFFSYLGTVYRESEMQIQHRNVGKMGAWGYVEAVLEILGFAVGGLAVYGYLLAQPFCDSCSRYLTAKGKQTRYGADELAFGELLHQIGASVQGDRLQEAIDLHAAFGEAKAGKAALIQSGFEVKRCPVCDIHWASFTTLRKSGREWQADATLGFAGFHQEELQVHG